MCFSFRNEDIDALHKKYPYSKLFWSVFSRSPNAGKYGNTGKCEHSLCSDGQEN